MKKFIFLAVLSLLTVVSANAQKQKITFDEDTILVDGVRYGILERKSGPSGDHVVKSLDGKEQIYLKLLDFYDPAKVSSSNPNGRETYFEVTFLNSGAKCEVDAPGGKKWTAKIIVENQLLKGNEVDADAEKKFILINGTKFTERKNALGGPKVIIIQN
jgi:hypothetical protein